MRLENFGTRFAFAIFDLLATLHLVLLKFVDERQLSGRALRLALRLAERHSHQPQQFTRFVVAIG